MSARLSGMQLATSSSRPSDRHVADRPRWPWIVLGAWVLLAAASFALQAGSGTSMYSGELWVGPVMGGYAVVGALVCTRRDGHRVGWLLLALALGVTADAALAGYGLRGGSFDSLRADSMARWLTSWLRESLMLAAALFLLLLFPNGRLASPRWRIVAGLGVVLIAVVVVGEALGNQVIALAPDRVEPNPLRFADPAGSTLANLGRLAFVAFAVPLVLAVGGLLLRLRRARGVERLQLKWLAYVALLLGIAFTLYGIFAEASLHLASDLPDGAPDGAPVPEVREVDRRSVFSIGVPNDPIGAVLATILLVTTAFGLPAAVGVAVLRHRIYDIDVVIRRTIVYSVLSATLGGAYLACILVLRELAQPLTGDSSIAVAASTLAVATLFRPARTWIGAAVDRRFYRARYDAARTVSAFGARLQHELDADTISRDMRDIVHETLHPTHVSIWLLDPKKRR